MLFSKKSMEKASPYRNSRSLPKADQSYSLASEN